MYDMHNINFFQEILGGRSDKTQSGNVRKKSQVTPIKYWLYTFSVLGLISHWSCNSTSLRAYSGPIYPPKASSCLHDCMISAGLCQKMQKKNSTNKGQHRSDAKENILCSHGVFLKVTLLGVYGFTPIWCYFHWECRKDPHHMSVSFLMHSQ